MKEEKRKAGQPKKDNPKIPFSTRLSSETVAIIKLQENQSEFIEKLVAESVTK